jgi:hypothetical protein
MLLRGKYGQGYATENAGVDTLNIEDLIQSSESIFKASPK